MIQPTPARFKFYSGFGLDVAGMLIDCGRCGDQIVIHFKQDRAGAFEFCGDKAAPTVIPEIACKSCKHKFYISGGNYEH
jgi:DNA-directed RNA polymerase subunit RPC12/RpoP